MREQSRRPRVGLALGGGGARGAAHIGVLRVLEAASIPIDCIAGTSVGAIVGAAYAAGIPVDEMDRLFSYVRLRDIFRPVWAKDGLMDNTPLAQHFERTVGRLDMKDLRIPFAAMATDAATGEAISLSAGPVPMVLRASAAIPCLTRPVEWEGRRLIDGGVAHKVPVRLTRSLGADIVIAVDLSNPSPWGGKRFRNPISYLMRVIEIMDQRLVANELAEAEVVIQPRAECGSLDFRHAKPLVRNGEDAALQALDAIRQRLAAPFTEAVSAAD